MNEIIQTGEIRNKMLKDKLTEIIYSEKTTLNIRRLAEYILHHFNSVAFMTAAELAEAAGTSQSTVTRFVTIFLEYSNFSSFIREIQDSVRNQISGTENHPVLAEGSDSAIDAYLHQEVDNLVQALRAVDERKLQIMAERIASKPTILVIGLRTGTHLAHYFHFILSKIHPDVRLVTSGGSGIYDKIVKLNPENTLAINFVFPRYPREMIEVIRFLKDRQVEQLTISDTYSLEEWGIAECHLVTPVNSTDLFESYAACYSVLNLLIGEVGKVNLQHTKEQLMSLERLYQENQVFYTKDK
ncbi:MurR/RpiR family transcriptional regulator [Gorillibacterium timonense]|uniref:MurR/RpiR family transcriptional regulator n=1 Tax=Gorillibacterium timonense TaxID=1689269 RepID=UPI000AA37086|nr:MurR/RpiR family transcriptional regulator [Gorillibacterium timonense]